MSFKEYFEKQILNEGLFKSTGNGEYVLDNVKIKFSKIGSDMYAKLYVLEDDKEFSLHNYTSKPIMNQTVVKNVVVELKNKFDLSSIEKIKKDRKLFDFLIDSGKDIYKNDKRF